MSDPQSNVTYGDVSDPFGISSHLASCDFHS